MNLNSRSIFLLDGLGAVVSFLLTGLVLPYFSNLIGLSPQVLYALAGFPFVYAIFSLGCYKFALKTKPWMLLIVIAANLVYCAISGIVISVFETLTPLGRLLLIAEIIVVLGVIALEFNVYKKADFQN